MNGITVMVWDYGDGLLNALNYLSLIFRPESQ